MVAMARGSLKATFEVQPNPSLVIITRNKHILNLARVMGVFEEADPAQTICSENLLSSIFLFTADKGSTNKT
jgi:hypothetical protein